MYSNKKLNLLKNLNKKKHFLKNEIKKIILKSILNNKNTKPIYRILAKYKYNNVSNKSYIYKQNNICLKTGKFKSLVRNTNYSRHFVKKLLINNMLQNFKVSKW